MFNRSIFSAILCASLLCSGCLHQVDGSESEEVIQSNESALTSGEIESSMALHPEDFRIGLRALVRAVQSPLTGSPLSPNVAGDALNKTAIFDSPGAKNAFALAMHCALAENDFLIGGNPKHTYMGGGLLLSAQNWRTSALSDRAAGELFACMAAQVNMNGLFRSILLSGPRLNTKGYDPNFFDFEEAVFVAVPKANSVSPEIHVWPKKDLSALCGQESEASLRMRLCGSGGTSQSTCNVVVHQAGTISDNCTGSDNQFTCLGRAAVATTLRSDDLDVFHPLCIKAPEEAQ